MKKRIYIFLLVFLLFFILGSNISMGDWSIIGEEGDGINDVNRVFVGSSSNNNLVHSSAEFHPNANFTITGLEVNTTSHAPSYNLGVDIYIDNSVAENAPYTDGAKVKDDWVVSWSGGWQSVTFDTNYDVINGQTYEIQFVSNATGGSERNIHIQLDSSATSPYYYWTHDSGVSYNGYADINFSILPGPPSNFTCSNDNAYQMNLSWVKNELELRFIMILVLVILIMV